MSALNKKGFEQDETRDHICFYHCWKSTGKRSGIWTRVSHSSKPKDLPKWLVSEMAKQLKLKKAQLVDLVSCEMDQLKYESVIEEKVRP